jgi:hypothetical protein
MSRRSRLVGASGGPCCPQIVVRAAAVAALVFLLLAGGSFSSFRGSIGNRDSGDLLLRVGSAGGGRTDVVPVAAAASDSALSPRSAPAPSHEELIALLAERNAQLAAVTAERDAERAKHSAASEALVIERATARTATPSPSPSGAPSLTNAGSWSPVMRVIDGVEGGAVLGAWPPRRLLAMLPLAVADGPTEGAALIVDNFFHLYRRPGPASALTWSARAQRSALLGVLDAPPSLGSSNVGQSASTSPPLPTCFALEGGKLRHPLVQQVGTFHEYKSGKLIVETGGSDYAKLQAKVQAPLTDPHEASVRALLWHRIGSADRELHGKDFFNSTENEKHCRFTSAGRARFCAKRRDYSRDFEPNPPCDPFVDPGHAHPNAADAPSGWPFCNTPTSPIAIVSYDCAFIESFSSHGGLPLRFVCGLILRNS